MLAVLVSLLALWLSVAPGALASADPPPPAAAAPAGEPAAAGEPGPSPSDADVQEPTAEGAPDQPAPAQDQPATTAGASAGADEAGAATDAADAPQKPGGGNASNTGNGNGGNGNGNHSAGGNGEADGQGRGASDETPENGADGGGSNDTATEPAPQADQSAQADQAAAVEGTATQEDAENTRVDVRIDTPGDALPGSQENAASSSAQAETGFSTVTDSGDEAVATVKTAPAPSTVAPDGGGPENGAAAGEDGGQGTAAATASTVQDDAANLNLSIRFRSPGDDGDVVQSNRADARASARADGEASAAATATQHRPSNTSVSVRIGSAGDNGDVDQHNVSTAAADAESTVEHGATATAAAVQEGARNTNVAIRVGSAGSNGSVTQFSSTTVSADPGLELDAGVPGGPSIVVRGTGINTAVSVTIPGGSLLSLISPSETVNGTTSVWRWIWTWNGSTPPTDPTSWTWRWAPVDEGNAVERENRTNAVAGMLVWRWDWARAGDTPDGVWDWLRQIPLSCACTWVWDWEWDWTTTDEPPTEPASSGPPAPAVSDGSGVVQRNDTAADAVGTADASVVQTVEQDGDGTVFAGQLASAAQRAEATARARQRRPRNVWTAPGPGRQETLVRASATTALETAIEQDIAQSVVAAAWAGQQVDVLQVGSAVATSTQDDAEGDTAAATESTATASARGRIFVVQRVDQTAKAPLPQWIGQLTQAGQALDATASSAQAGDGPLQTGARRSKADGQAAALAVVLQSAAQSGDEEAVGGQTARQLVQSLQTATADADTMQSALSPPGAASSHAYSGAAALAEQIAVQILLEAGVQDATQNLLFVQDGLAASSSAGGIGGDGTVDNCATAQQSVTQTIGVVVTAPVSDVALSFCTPPPVPAAAPASEAPASEAPVVAAAGDEPSWPSSSIRRAKAPRRTTVPRHVTRLAPLSVGKPWAFERQAPAQHPAASSPEDAFTVQEEVIIQDSTRTTAEPAQTLPPLAPRVEKTGETSPSPVELSLPGEPGSVSPGGSAGSGAALDASVPGFEPPGGGRLQTEPTVRRSEHVFGFLESPG